MTDKAVPAKLDAYLEEVSHYLAGRAEREEILTEIRSHVLEKAEAEFGDAGDAALAKVIAGYGPPRRVAERYLDGRPIIAPAYRRYLVRYTSFLFAIHAALTLVAVVFKKSFVMFPFIFMPRLGVFDAVMYLPTAFLTDLGFVALVLYFITQSGKDVRLPWPKFALDLDEVKPPAKGTVWEKVFLAAGAVAMLAVTDFALSLYVKHRTIFFVNLDWRNPRPLLTPEVGQRLSLIIIAGFASWTLAMFAKILFTTRWIDVVSDAVSLVIIGLLLGQPFDNPFAVNVPAAALSKIKFALTFLLLFVALMTTIDLVKNLIRIGRRRLAK
jgi:hypothetical protein